MGNNPRSVEEIKFKKSAAGVLMMEQSAFAMEGKVPPKEKAPSDVIQKQAITAHFDVLRNLYEAARDRDNQPCLTLFEGISYSAAHVLGYNIVVTGPWKEEATETLR